MISDPITGCGPCGPVIFQPGECECLSEEGLADLTAQVSALRQFIEPDEVDCFFFSTVDYNLRMFPPRTQLPEAAGYY